MFGISSLIALHRARTMQLQSDSVSSHSERGINWGQKGSQQDCAADPRRAGHCTDCNRIAVTLTARSPATNAGCTPATPALLRQGDQSGRTVRATATLPFNVRGASTAQTQTNAPTNPESTRMRGNLAGKHADGGRRARQRGRRLSVYRSELFATRANEGSGRSLGRSERTDGEEKGVTGD